MNQPWRWVLVGELAAMIGGLFWAVKAVAILVAGVEPPILFDVAALLFPMAVYGVVRRARTAGSSTSPL